MNENETAETERLVLIDAAVSVIDSFVRYGDSTNRDDVLTAAKEFLKQQFEKHIVK